VQSIMTRQYFPLRPAETYIASSLKLFDKSSPASSLRPSNDTATTKARCLKPPTRSLLRNELSQNTLQSMLSSLVLRLHVIRFGEPSSKKVLIRRHGVSAVGDHDLIKQCNKRWQHCAIDSEAYEGVLRRHVLLSMLNMRCAQMGKYEGLQAHLNLRICSLTTTRGTRLHISQPILAQTEYTCHTTFQPPVLSSGPVQEPIPQHQYTPHDSSPFTLILSRIQRMLYIIK
jgi:hypothetical protein